MGITVWNCNPSTSTSYYSTNRNVESVSIFFTMHLRELFTLFSLLVMMMAPSECSDVLKHKDEMAEGGGLWTADSNEELESRSDNMCCSGDVCHSGYMCGPQFRFRHCCPNGMKCTHSGTGCVTIAVKRENEMAEGRGLWTLDSNEDLESLPDGVGARCCVNGKCWNGFQCGPQFLPPDRCCPVGMLCTSDGPGCI